MSNYVELPVEKIEFDISNPRIARGVAYYNPIAVLLLVWIRRGDITGMAFCDYVGCNANFYDPCN